MRRDKTVREIGKSGDAFGTALLDYHAGKCQHYFIEREDGHLDCGDLGMYFAKFENWSNIEKEAAREVRGRYVLDIGCGAGRHLIAQTNMGRFVSGMDVSAGALEVCCLRGVPETQLVKMSITSVGNFSEGRYDTIIMMGNNFGLFGSFERAHSLLVDMHRITHPYTGRIVAQTLNPYETDNPDHLAYQEFNRARGRMPGQIRFRVRYKNLINPWMDYLFVSVDELRQIVAGTGWRIEKIIATEGSPVYIMVLAKEG